MSNIAAHTQAVQGGLQAHSVAGPYPYIVMAIDNPKGYPPGLYWYVVDSRKGSTDFKDRCGVAMKGVLAATFAGCQASAMYQHNILGLSLFEAEKAYDPYWAGVEVEGEQEGVMDPTGEDEYEMDSPMAELLAQTKQG